MQIEEFKSIYWLLPEINLISIILGLLAYGVIYRTSSNGLYSQQKKITWLSIIGLGCTFFLINGIFCELEQGEIIEIGTLMGIDKYILIVKEIILLSGIGILILSLDYYAKDNFKDYEYTQLIIISILGMLLLVSSKDLIVLYLSIELISLSLYILAGIERKKELSTEAGLKYFIMGALSSGILLMGSAIIYIETGDTNFTAIGQYIMYSDSQQGLEIGSMLIVVAFLFKLAAAPFHMWAPDVYEGSPTIITAFFAIVPKFSILSTLIILIYGPFLGIWSNMLQNVILGCGIISIIIASIGGINQAMLKRLIAYSAIGHIGFMLLGLGVATFSSLQATLLYLFFYLLMSFNLFTFLLIVLKKGGNHITQLWNISRKAPVLAITFTICLFSIAGIPPLAGFFSKWIILLTVVESQYYALALIAVLFSAVSCFYYLRLIHFLYFQDTPPYLLHALNSNLLQSSHISVSFERSLILGVSLYLILTLLFYPNPLLMISFDCLINSLA